MSRESCIEHPAGDKFAMLRTDYMALCEGDACAAMLLHTFEHWLNHRIKSREERGQGDLWAFRSIDTLAEEDLCGAFSRGKVASAVADLIEAGFLKRRRNPDRRRRWDRTWHYQLQAEAVQEAINGLSKHCPDLINRESEIGQSNPQNRASNTRDSARDPAVDPEQQPSSKGNDGVTGTRPKVAGPC